MIITISAELTEAQIDILAEQKWYQDNVASLSDENVVTLVQNPQSKEDFIRNVYQNLIVMDATKEFISYENSKNEQERLTMEQIIRDSVTQSITSTAE